MTLQKNNSNIDIFQEYIYNVSELIFVIEMNDFLSTIINIQILLSKKDIHDCQE